MSFGTLETFDKDNKKWAVYIDRLKKYIVLNKIKDEQRVPLLITAVGDKTYSLIYQLCAPVDPATKTFDDLVKLVSDHLEEKSTEIAERTIFRARKQRDNESLNEFLEELKFLAATCNFGSRLEECLRDQFVSGLAKISIQKKIFDEKFTDFKEIVEFALKLEIAERQKKNNDADNLKNTQTVFPENRKITHVVEKSLQETEKTKSISNVSANIEAPTEIVIAVPPKEKAMCVENPSVVDNVRSNEDLSQKMQALVVSGPSNNIFIGRNKPFTFTINKQTMKILYQTIYKPDTALSLKTNLLSQGHDLIGVIETNRIRINNNYSTVNDTELTLDNWSVIRRDRPSWDSAVMIATRPGLKLTRLRTLETDIGDDLWVSVTLQGRLVNICVVHIKFTEDSKENFKKWCTKVEGLIPTLKGTVIILGNIHALHLPPFNIDDFNAFLGKCNLYNINNPTGSFDGCLDIVLMQKSVISTIAVTEEKSQLFGPHKHNPQLSIDALV